MKNLVILMLLISLFSCKKELTFKDIFFEQKAKIPNKYGSPKATAVIPLAKNKSEAADSINQNIFNCVQKIVYNQDAPKAFKDYSELLLDFVTRYDKILAENPGEPFGWTTEIKGKIKHQSEKLINFEIAFYSFTGGAHGYGGLQSIFVDAVTGKKIENKNLFKDETTFKTFAEKIFRIKYKIPEGKSLNDNMFMFKDDKFQLPENYFFTDGGLLLYYNQYEIASYAQGPQQLLLTYKEVEPFLAIK